jgi:hypothetical protein
MLDREFAELGDDGIQSRQPDALDCALDGECVRDRVDVLARAGEVRQLGDRVEAQGREAVAHEVLDGLDVVAGDGFLLGEPVDLGLAEVAVEGAQALLVGIRQRRGLEERAVGEGDEPLDLDLDAGPVEAGLREEVGESGDGAAVATVEGAQGLRRKRRLESQGSPPDRARQMRGVRGWRRAGSS